MTTEIIKDTISVLVVWTDQNKYYAEIYDKDLMSTRVPGKINYLHYDNCWNIFNIISKFPTNDNLVKIIKCIEQRSPIKSSWIIQSPAYLSSSNQLVELQEAGFSLDKEAISVTRIRCTALARDPITDIIIGYISAYYDNKSKVVNILAISGKLSTSFKFLLTYKLLNAIKYIAFDSFPIYAKQHSILTKFIPIIPKMKKIRAFYTD
jgi:hypothetical protein